MRKPLLKYILLTLAIVIWGAVFYRIYYAITPTREILTPRVHQKSVDVIGDSLLLNYRNPFATNTESPPKIQATRLPIRQSQVRPIRNKRPAPLNAKYLGRVIRGSRVYSILEFPIGNFLLQKGDTIHGLKIIEIFDDSLKVRNSEMDCTIILNR